MCETIFGQAASNSLKTPPTRVKRSIEHYIPVSPVIVIIILCLTPAIPAVNPVEVPKEPEFVIFASYSHPPNTPMRHSVLKEMVSRIITLKYIHFSCKFLLTQ